MKEFKQYIIPLFLTIITLCEILVTKDLIGSVFLWLGYGAGKILLD